MDVGTAFPTGPEPTWPVQPAETVFDDPAEHSQPRAVIVTATGDDRRDAAIAE